MYDDIDMGALALDDGAGAGAGAGAGVGPPPTNAGNATTLGYDTLDLDLDQLNGDLGGGVDDLLLDDMLGGGGDPFGRHAGGLATAPAPAAWDDLMTFNTPANRVTFAPNTVVKPEPTLAGSGAPPSGMPPRSVPVAVPPSATTGFAPASTAPAAAAAGPILTGAALEAELGTFRKGFRSGNKDASINVAVRDNKLPFGAVLQVMWATKPRLQRRNVKTHPMRLLRCLLRAYMARDNAPQAPQMQHLATRGHFRAFLSSRPEPGTRLMSLIQSMLPPHERIPIAIAQDLQLTFNVLVPDELGEETGRMTIGQAVDAMYCTLCDEMMCYRGCRVRHPGSRGSRGGAGGAGAGAMGTPPTGRSRVRVRGRIGSDSSFASGADTPMSASPSVAAMSPASARKGSKKRTREYRERAASRPAGNTRPQVPVAGKPATWLKPPLIAFQDYSGPKDVDVELMGRSSVNNKIWSPPVARVQSCPWHYDALLFVTGDAPPLDSADPNMTVDVFTKGKDSVLPELTFDIYYEDMGGANPQEMHVPVPSHDAAMEDAGAAPSTPAPKPRDVKRQARGATAWDTWGGDPVVSPSTYRVFRLLCVSGLQLLESTARARLDSGASHHVHGSPGSAPMTGLRAGSSASPMPAGADVADVEVAREACVALCKAMYCVALAQYDPAAFWSSVSGPGGVTLLHVAAALGCERVVNTMLQSGADANAACVAGTPAQLAAASGYDDLAATLSQDPFSDGSSVMSLGPSRAPRRPNFIGRETLALFKSTLALLSDTAIPMFSETAFAPGPQRRADAAWVLTRQLQRSMCVLSAQFEGDHTFLWGRLTSSSGWQLLHCAAGLGVHTAVLGLHNLGADMWGAPPIGGYTDAPGAAVMAPTAADVATGFRRPVLAQFLSRYTPAGLPPITSSSDSDGETLGELSVGSPPGRRVSMAERVRRGSARSNGDPINSSVGGPASVGGSSAAASSHHRDRAVPTAKDKLVNGSIGYGTTASYAPPASSQTYDARSRGSKSSHGSGRSSKSGQSAQFAQAFRHSNGAFLVMVLLGIAMLLPWNIIVFAVDYFDFLYPGESFEYWSAAAYIVPQLPMAVVMMRVSHRVVCMRWDVAALATRQLTRALWCLVCPQHGEKVSAVARLFSALLAQTVLLLAIPEVSSNLSDAKDISMIISLVLIALSGFAAQVTISSVLSFAAQLPPVCTQAVLVGLGATGVLGALGRIATKATVTEPSVSGLVFFAVGAAFSAIAAMGLIWLSNTRYTEYHINKAFHRRNTSRTTSSAASAGRHRVWAPLITDVERGEPPLERGSWAHFSELSGKVWAYASSAAVVFFTTFVLWPGEMTNIHYKHTFSTFNDLDHAHWWPIVLLTVFNIFDLASRCLPQKYYQCGEKFALVSPPALPPCCMVRQVRGAHTCLCCVLVHSCHPSPGR